MSSHRVLGSLWLELQLELGSEMWRKQSSHPKVCRGKEEFINPPVTTTPQDCNTWLQFLLHIGPQLQRKKTIVWDSQVNFEEEMKL